MQLNTIEVGLDKHMKTYGNINYSTFVSIKYYINYKKNKAGYAIDFIIKDKEELDNIKKYMQEYFDITTIEYESKKSITYFVNTNIFYKICAFIKINK